MLKRGVSFVLGGLCLIGSACAGDSDSNIDGRNSQDPNTQKFLTVETLGALPVCGFENNNTLAWVSSTQVFAHCEEGEWVEVSITGPKGDKGDKGDPGADGTNGIDGTDGVDGTNGVDGTDGEDGAKGDKGDKGDTGADGVSGSGLDLGTWIVHGITFKILVFSNNGSLVSTQSPMDVNGYTETLYGKISSNGNIEGLDVVTGLSFGGCYYATSGCPVDGTCYLRPSISPTGYSLSYGTFWSEKRAEGEVIWFYRTKGAMGLTATTMLSSASNDYITGITSCYNAEFGAPDVTPATGTFTPSGVVP